MRYNVHFRFSIYQQVCNRLAASHHGASTMVETALTPGVGIGPAHHTAAIYALISTNQHR